MKPWTLFLIPFIEAAPKKKAPLVEENPYEIDFLNVVTLPMDLGIRFKYRDQWLYLKYNHELHFPGIKKYYLASYNTEEVTGKNITNCVYDVTKNHEFPQLLDEPNEVNLLVFRCPHGCRLDDVGCKPSWDTVKIAIGLLIVLFLLLLLLCFRYHKARDKMKAAAFDARIQAQMIENKTFDYALSLP